MVKLKCIHVLEVDVYEIIYVLIIDYQLNKIHYAENVLKDSKNGMDNVLIVVIPLVLLWYNSYLA